MKAYLLSGLFLLLAACVPDNSEAILSPGEASLFRVVSSEESGVTFNNQLSESAELNIITFEYFYNGAGVGVGDFNRDGWPDLFFSANMSDNRLYLNRGDSTEIHFREVTEEAGILNRGKWATGVSITDINQDGWPDIYLCYAGPFLEAEQRANELYINQQDGTFREMAEAYGLADTGHSTMAAFLDYDRDGDLDMYLLTNITDETGPNVIRKKRLLGQMPNTDRLYRNEGLGPDGHPIFQDVSRKAGITIEGYGLGVSVVDINHDGWPDIYVSNDYLSNDLFYINNRDGTFTDRAADLFKHQSYSAMGHDVADFNNDGLSDILTLDMLPPDNLRQKLMFGETNYNRHRSELQYGYQPQFMRNTLQWNQGFYRDSLPLFSDIGQLAGVSATDWSWSALWADLDLDGARDLLITNGYPRDITNRDFASYKMQEFSRANYDEDMKNRFVAAIQEIPGAHLPNYVYRNEGNLRFHDVSREWGFQQPTFSSGAAYVDLDNDGDLDYVTNNTNAEALIYENRSDAQPDRHFLQISLKGAAGNRGGLGAKIWCYAAGTLLYAEHYPFRGYQSSVEPRIHFGLGDAPQVDSLKVQWPGGKVQWLYDLLTDRHIILEESAAQAETRQTQPGVPMFEEVSRQLGINFRHAEQHYNDFAVQPLLPHKLSQAGPGLAVADINGDGLDDFFIGGAFEQSGSLFFQNKDGSFREMPLTSDEKKYEEDQAALFLDVDSDGDPDLYVVSGGNEFRAGSEYYQDRFYLNDGQGQFSPAPERLPVMKVPGSCVVAADYDRDGDPDLFVGGRHTPQQYPAPGNSFLLENREGFFVDVTEEKAPGLQKAGMVTTALWTDIDDDGWPDLMIAGEWMAPLVFRNLDGKLQKQAIAELDRQSGWWNILLGVDLDQDGDTDFIGGNLGLNSRYRADSLQPLQLFVNDFNRDRRVDGILAYRQDGRLFPMHPRDDVLRQLNFLKRKFTSYQSFAEADMAQIFTPELLERSALLESRQMQSCYLENLGNFRFRVHPLPPEAQVAPVSGILSGDFNEDSYPDLLLNGNDFASEVIQGPHDAFNGLLLLGDGKGGFRPQASRHTGFWVTGDAQALVHLRAATGPPLLLAAQNDGQLLAFRQKVESKRYIRSSAANKTLWLSFPDGRQQKVETYQGSSYLGQSSADIWLSGGEPEVTH
jgi:hypothetical protein